MGDDRDKSPIATISGLAIIMAALGFTVFTANPFKARALIKPKGTLLIC